MNKKYIGSGAVIVAILLVSVAYWALRDPADPALSTDTTGSPSSFQRATTIPTRTSKATTTEVSQEKEEEPLDSAAQNLERIKKSRHRNTNHDNSSFIDISSENLPIDALTVSWKEYEKAGLTGVIEGSGSFRVQCEFSHFAYDDPIIFPNKPGASHLHMFFGNTNANAYSTYSSLLNSGSSTCNGQELNRTSYWVPALLSPEGTVAIPDELLVYYKAYAGASGSTEVYPENMQLISGNSMATSPQPGTKDFRELFFRCYTSGTSTGDLSLNPKSVEIPRCPDGSRLEMNIKFQTCWNGEDPSRFKQNASYSNVWPTSGECPASHPRKLPQMEYRIFFSDHSGSENWFLSSDVSASDAKTVGSNGFSLHGDWFGAWNKEVNQQWIDNCVNIINSDCDEGLLADYRRDANAKALRLRPEYSGSSVVSAKELLSDLCVEEKLYEGASSAALCETDTMMQMM